MVKLSIESLRAKDIETLEADVVGLKEALLKARIDIQLKSSKHDVKSILDIKRNVARTLSVISQKSRENLAKRIVEEKIQPRDIPKRLRPKLTRALRRKLTPAQEKKKLPKVVRKLALCKLRKYAVLA